MKWIKKAGAIGRTLKITIDVVEDVVVDKVIVNVDQKTQSPLTRKKVQPTQMQESWSARIKTNMERSYTREMFCYARICFVRLMIWVFIISCLMRWIGPGLMIDGFGNLGMVIPIWLLMIKQALLKIVQLFVELSKNLRIFLEWM